MVDVWYCEAIEKIRFTAKEGGEALSVEEAKTRLAEMQRAIETAENAKDDNAKLVRNE